MQNYLNEEVNKIEIRTSKISGKGTFAKTHIQSGELIKTLTGEPIITPDVTEICAKLGISGDDPLQIGDALFLILNYASRAINHSCNPNAGVRNISDLYAIQNICADDEIVFDYSTTSGINDVWTMSCRCGDKTCRGKIGNVLTIPSYTLLHYLKLSALPIFIKHQLRNMGHLECEQNSRRPSGRRKI